MWKWLQSYRVWAANAKTFLTPDNWLNPDATATRRRRRRKR